MVTIEPVSLKNAEEIYKFEVDNRTFFELSLPSRGDDYYTLSNFGNIINDIIYDQSKGVLFMNIIRNEQNEMVGRVNLFPIEHERFNRAFELGYRIGEKHQGKGYASEAIKIVCQQAFSSLGLDCIQALTSQKNLASQKVLAKNGFEFIKIIQNDVEVNGIWEDSVVFEYALDS